MTARPERLSEPLPNHLRPQAGAVDVKRTFDHAVRARHQPRDGAGLIQLHRIDRIGHMPYATLLRDRREKIRETEGIEVVGIVQRTAIPVFMRAFRRQRSVGAPLLNRYGSREIHAAAGVTQQPEGQQLHAIYPLWKFERME